MVWRKNESKLRHQWTNITILLFLKNNKNIVIKAAIKWSVVVFWDRDDYTKEAEKQLRDIDV